MGRARGSAGVGGCTVAWSAAKPANCAPAMMAATSSCSRACARARIERRRASHGLDAHPLTHHCMRQHRTVAPQTLPPPASRERSRTEWVSDESAHSETHMGGSDSDAWAAENGSREGGREKS